MPLAIGFAIQSRPCCKSSNARTPKDAELVLPFSVCSIRARSFRGAILFQRDGEDFIDVNDLNEFQSSFPLFNTTDQISSVQFPTDHFEADRAHPVKTVVFRTS